jgi:hypothetical protein
VSALGIAVFVVLVLHSVQDSNRRLAEGQAAQATVIARLSTSLDTTRQQLQQHGVTPSAPPAQSIVGGVPGVPGATGTPGRPGPSGAPGPSGSPGPTGPTGKTGSAGADGTPGATGPPGAAGNDGQTGAQGDPGPAGPQGDPGPAGPAGADGTNGTDGRDGTNGSPPAGWTYTDPNGVAYTCSPVDGFDPQSPRYTCAPDVTATPTPTGSANTSAFLGVGMLAGTAMYRRL